MTVSTPTDAVTAIGRLNITGNVIPSTWWRHVVLPSGKPDCTAIVLLSDIVYWYRPAEVRDEQTGAVVGHCKRFHGDKLQRSYQAFADQFGFSKREATDALKRLRDAGLVTLELRTVQTDAGLTLSNVLYVEPVVSRIIEITTTVLTEQEVRKNVTPPTFKRNTLLRSDVTPDTPKSETYTETTTETTHTEITTENKTHGASADAPAPRDPAKQEYSPEFEAAWKAYPKRAGGNSKKGAWGAWKARLKEGVTAEAMAEGVKRYAAWVSASGQVGTQYVKQAQTFFGPDHHFAEEYTIPAQARQNTAAINHSSFDNRDYGQMETPSWYRGE
jgi:hypothetical protein